MKKLLSMLLACALLVSCVPAMAAESSSSKTTVKHYEGFSYENNDKFRSSIYKITSQSDNTFKKENLVSTDGNLTQVNQDGITGQELALLQSKDEESKSFLFPFASAVTEGTIKVSFNLWMAQSLLPNNYAIGFGFHDTKRTATSYSWNGDWTDATLISGFTRWNSGSNRDNAISFNQSKNIWTKSRSKIASYYGAEKSDVMEYDNPSGGILDVGAHNRCLWHIDISLDMSTGAYTSSFSRIGTEGKNTITGTIPETYLSGASFDGFVLCGINSYKSVDATLYIDNLNVINEIPQPADPETLDTYSVKSYVPDTGIIMKDNFNGYSSMNDLKFASGGMYYAPGSFDLKTEDTNKFIRTRWNSYNAYKMCQNLGTNYSKDINTGSLSLSYDVRVIKQNNIQMTEDDANSLTMVLWSKNSWDNSLSSGRYYFNRVMYDNAQPYVIYADIVNPGGMPSLNADGDNKVNINFDSWYNIKVVIDYDNGTVKQYVGDNLVSTVAASKDTLANYGFDVLQFERQNKKNDYYIKDDYTSTFEIDFDNIRVERLDTTAVASSTKITKGGTELAKSDVASLAGTELSVNFTAASAGKGNVVVAAYKNSELIGIVCSLDNTLKAGENSVSVTASSNFNGADTVKAFVFDNFNNMYPVADAAQYLAN